jgi:NSS family neurotransmitter:Na+ symporter
MAAMRRRSLWGTRFGFYLAAIGSAFGLGNLWRFPYIVVENGGGAFVLLYIFLALVMGLPLLIGELMLGKLTRRSAIAAVRQACIDPLISVGSTPRERRLLSWSGKLAVFASLLVLAYYAVISGWVLHFLVRFVFAELQTKTISSSGISGFDPDQALQVLRNSGFLQVALASVHLLVTIVVVVKGVQEGIEKWVGNVMPIFVVLLLVLVVKALSLPSAEQALRFLFYPDFSKLTYSSLLQAIGHVCFTLSIGFGTMVTFGSYLNERTRLPGAGFRVTAMDTSISLFAGLLIFPIVLGTVVNVPGPELLFHTLPRLFLGLHGGFFYGVAFFLCLYLASLGASIGLLESIVSNWMDDSRISRRAAAWVTGFGAFLIAIVPALSSSVLRGVNYQGHGILEILDGILINGILPIIALSLALVVSFKIKANLKETEFVNDETITTRKLLSHWNFVLRYLAPGLIVFAFFLAFVGWLRS